MSRGLTGEVESTFSSGMELVCFVAIFSYFVACHVISKSHSFRWVPESAVIILFGLFTSFVLSAMDSGYNAVFNTELFFKLLLPPIIFVSGFKINLNVFYENLTTIMVFANVGTILNMVVFALCMYGCGLLDISTKLSFTESMSFGSVISATDPVTTIAVFDHLQVEPVLYTIIVGVSVLDDAVSIIFFDLFNSFIANDGSSSSHSVGYYISYCVGQFLLIFGGSVLIGYISGMSFAYFLKRNPSLLENSGLLHCMAICLVFISYLTADTLHLSGIISSMFCGIVLQRYCLLFLDTKSMGEVTNTVSLLAQFLETCVFFMIGYSLLQNTSNQSADGVFVGWSLFFCLVSRAAQIYPLSCMLNLCNKPYTALPTSEANAGDSSDVKISSSSNVNKSLSWGYQHVMMVAGLRGPIAYATAKLFPDTYGHNNLIAFTSGVIVLSTIVLLGPLTTPTLHWCKIQFGAEVADEAADGETGTSEQKQRQHQGLDGSSPLSISVNTHFDVESNSGRNSGRSSAVLSTDGEWSSSSSAPASPQAFNSRMNRLNSSSNDSQNVHHTASSSSSRSASSPSSTLIGRICDVVHCRKVWRWLERVELQYVAALFTDSGETSMLVKCSLFESGESSCCTSLCSRFFSSTDHNNKSNNKSGSSNNKNEGDDNLFHALSLDSSHGAAHGHIQLSAVHSGGSKSKGLREDPEAKRRRIKAEDYNRMLALVQDSVNVSVATSNPLYSNNSNSNV